MGYGFSFEIWVGILDFGIILSFAFRFTVYLQFTQLHGGTDVFTQLIVDASFPSPLLYVGDQRLDQAQWDQLSDQLGGVFAVESTVGFFIFSLCTQHFDVAPVSHLFIALLDMYLFISATGDN